MFVGQGYAQLARNRAQGIESRRRFRAFGEGGCGSRGNHVHMNKESAQRDDADPAEIERLWYVPPSPPKRRGWLVYSTDFLLAVLQGCARRPELVRRTAWWRAVAAPLQAATGVVQAIIILFASVPLVCSLVEIAARVWTRSAFGFFLRACYWKAHLRSLGQDTIIDQGVEIWGPANVSIGSCSHIDTNVRLAAGERSQRQHGSIVIGDYVHVGPGVHIAGRGGVEIQDFVSIAAQAHLYSASNTIEHPDDPGQLISMSHSAPAGYQHTTEKPIVIEAYAFLGMMSRVLPGVRVGRGAIVHSGVELARDVPPFANFGGLPGARQIGWRKPRRKSPKHGQAPAERASPAEAACGESGRGAS